MAAIHPNQALYAGERPLPILASCEHYAGSEKLAKKALELQAVRGGGFDVTFDLEDGAPKGREVAHAELAAELVLSSSNTLGRLGVRIHAPHEPSWTRDVELVLGRAAGRVAYLTIPKARSAAELRDVLEFIRGVERRARAKRATPIHVLIETHGALREVHAIAALPSVEVLDFGLMDFISDHHGAIPASAMRSPGQFDHALLRRAKAEITAAALGAGVVPAHNVSLDLKDREATRSDARRAREEFGFLRMWSIHPEQIEPIIEAMRPDFGDLGAAGEILLAAAARDWGPIEYRGKLQDRASYRLHWALLQRARVEGLALSAEIEAAFFQGPFS